MIFDTALNDSIQINSIKSNHVYWPNEQKKLQSATKVNYKNSIRVGDDRVEQVREGIPGNGLERDCRVS